MEIKRHTLSNGLRVVAEHDRQTSMACVTVLYNVGARYESAEHTGMAHLFEHLMFGGSKHVEDYDAPLQMAGGWSNAWTSNDFTMFYDVVPAENIATPFWLESDRMLALNLSERALEVQRSVVVEEFKQVCLNQPFGDMGHHLRSLLYKVHPYRWPTIGLKPEHIQEVTPELVRDFYFSHYSPQNAVLAVSGNVEPEKVFELAERWFGPIEQRTIALPDYKPEPIITEPRRKTVSGRVPHTRLTIAFPMGGYHSQHYMAADILTDILASGNSSRLYRMVMEGVEGLSAADASIAGSEDPGYLMLNAIVAGNDAAALKRSEEALWQQICRVAADGVTDQEVSRALTRYESNQLFSQLSYINKSQNLALSAMHHEHPDEVLAAYKRLTAADIQAAAQAILSEERACTLVYNPE